MRFMMILDVSAAYQAGQFPTTVGVFRGERCEVVRELTGNRAEVKLVNNQQFDGKTFIVNHEFLLEEKKKK